MLGAALPSGHGDHCRGRCKLVTVAMRLEISLDRLGISLDRPRSPPTVPDLPSQPLSQLFRAASPCQNCWPCTKRELETRVGHTYTFLHG
jgi:hypothetical protein